MKLLVRSKFGRRFLITFLLMALPAVAAGWFGIVSVTKAMREQTHALLRVASDGAEADMREFLASMRRATESRAAEEQILLALKSPNESGVDLSNLLQDLQSRIAEVREIFCLNLQGRVVGSSLPGQIGRDESSSVEFKQGRESFYPGDIVREAGSGAIRWRMSAPVKEPGTGRPLGVVVVGINPGALSALTTGKRALSQGAETQSFRMGATGETYLVDRNGFLLTESRFAPNSVLSLKVRTEPVRMAVERGQEIIADYKDYRGVSVTGASAILKDMGWVLVTEIDFSQSFAPIARLRKVFIGLALTIGFVAAWIGSVFARGIVDPLQATSEADRALARGDQQRALVPERNLPRDEIGDFIQQRNANIRKLFEHERELVKEQKRRAEAAAALQGISYSMVHDMRAPLRAIITFGDLTKEEANERLTQAEKQYLDQMRNASLRMDRLICDMLRYSSLLQADVPLNTVNLPDLFRRAIEENPTLRSHKADIQVEEQMPLINGNAAVLTECFSALLDNAFRYTRSGVTAKVKVWGENKDGWMQLFVEDNGTGMSKQFQARLFGIFQKGTHSQEGTGISLALVRVAVERMGGRVGVTSQEGKGSRFWIELKPAEDSMESTIL